MRKNILTFTLCAFALFMASCAPQKLPPPVDTVSIVDYRRYSNRGFFITESNSVGVQYEGIASVVVEVIRKVKLEETIINPARKPQAELSIRNWREKETYVKKEIYKDISIYNAIDKFYEQCIELGANGVINFKITTNTKYHDGVSIPTYVISGMAIRRASNNDYGL